MEWIKIKDDKSNLPEHFKTVLITTNRGFTYAAYRDYKEIWFILNDDRTIHTSKIIAYMYLPKPFKE